MPPLTRKLHPFDLKSVMIDDRFWSPRLETNRKVTIPHLYEQCKKTGRIDAPLADWKPGKPNKPHPFWDSDLAKWVEAASYALTTHPGPSLEKRLEELVDRIASAQQPDGYLNTYFTTVEPDGRWTNLRDRHELYCAGHLMEAAVAHWKATGNRKLLNVMSRCADYIVSVFGPGGAKKGGYGGHEEIELALVKLYRATGRKQYLNLGKLFIDRRGRRPHYFDIEAKARGEQPEQFHRSYDYFQAHLPVRRQRDPVGHAVRAMYLYCGMADVAGETGDAKLLEACKRLWEGVTVRKMYITGGVGSRREGEAFGSDYELPGETAYAETCAAIGLIFFAHRMLQIDPHARYADVMERALYNGALSGIGRNGKRFFYENPLSSPGAHHREEWYRCSCCPPNIARLLGSLGMYAYSAADRAAYVHLYIAGTAHTEITAKQVMLTQQTRYPWDGEVRITVKVDRPVRFALMLRIPGWSRNHKIKLNGKTIPAPLVKGYARILRLWRGGETVALSLEMPVERMDAHPSVADAAGKVALQRGPVVYCLEGCDHSVDVRTISLPDQAKLTTRFDRKLLGGCVVIEGTARAPSLPGWSKVLYRPVGRPATKTTRIRAIPYCLWDNRKGGSMTVFIPRA